MYDVLCYFPFYSLSFLKNARYDPVNWFQDLLMGCDLHFEKHSPTSQFQWLFCILNSRVYKLCGIIEEILSSLFFLYAEEWNFYIPHSWYKNFPQENFFVYRNNFVTACRGEAAVKGVAEPLSARNKQIWDGEHLATGQKGRSWVKKNRGLLETRISNTEFLLFALLCCNLIYSLKCSVRLNITWVSFHQVIEIQLKLD